MKELIGMNNTYIKKGITDSIDLSCACLFISCLDGPAMD